MPADRPSTTSLYTALDTIQAELERLFPGLPEPTAADVANGGAFGAATMAFAQWLRFVFVPIARRRVSAGDLPGDSSVAAQAVREFDGFPDATGLIGMLAEFDAIVAGR